MSRPDFASDRVAMTERQCFSLFIEHVSHAAECAAGVAQLRKDPEWLKVRLILEEVRDRAKKKFNRGTGLILLR